MKKNLNIFVFFSQVDNLMDETSQTGWAGGFCTYLRFYFSSLLKIPHQLSFHSDEHFVRADLVEKADVILMIVSPAFFLADHAATLLEHIGKRQAKNGEGDDLLTFKVRRAPYSDGEELLGRITAHDVYFFEGKADKLNDYSEFKPNPSLPEGDNQYWLKINDILQLVTAFFSSKEKKGKIYIGTTPLFSRVRDSLASELIRQGFSMLPDSVKQTVPAKAKNRSRSLNTQIADSSLVVLFPGDIEVEEEVKAIISDIELSILHNKHLILWFGDKSYTLEREESKFSRLILRSLRDYKLHDIFVGTKEELINFCKQYLGSGFYHSFEPAQVFHYVGTGKKVVNLVSTKKSSGFYTRFKQRVLESTNIELDERNENEFLDFSSYQDQILRANILVIYFEAQSLNWLIANLVEARKMIGYRKGTPLDAIAIATNNLDSLEDLRQSFNFTIVSEISSNTFPTLTPEDFCSKFLS